MDRLPPLNPLRAFEAAGQLQSIRGAAERLSVTPGAVSRQVQVLESYLGVRLFRRFAREVMLTAEGEQYLEAVSLHLEGIRDATERLTGRRGIETLRVRAYTTIAMKWLIPRLSTFQDANPKIEVRLTTSNEAVDFSRENIDGAIRLGDGAWTGVEVDRLMANELTPLCTPAYQRRHKLRHADDLARARLLHSFVRPDDWRIWLGEARVRDIDAHAGDKFASSTLAYQAVLEGQGIMMAQRLLFADDLRTGRLVQPFDTVVDRDPFTYYFIYPRNRLRNSAFRRFRTWLLNQAQIRLPLRAVEAG